MHDRTHVSDHQGSYVLIESLDKSNPPKHPDSSLIDLNPAPNPSANSSSSSIIFILINITFLSCGRSVLILISNLIYSWNRPKLFSSFRDNVA